ncbi:MAG: phosphatase PAP2 family protein [Campylobacterales bacterium]
MERFLKNLLPIFLVYIAFFLLFPQVDIYFSKLFMDESGHFVPKDAPLTSAIYYSVEYLGITILIVFITFFTYESIKKKPLIKELNKKAILFALAFIVVANGVIINSTLKELSGRARPSKVIELGGEQQFSPPLIKAYECSNHNCSFSSGHSGFAFSMLVFAFIFRKYADKIFFASIIYGLAVSLTRIAQGGHFLSDTLFSFFVAAFSAQLFYYLFYPDRSPSYYRKNGVFFALFYLGLTVYYFFGALLG